MKPIHECCFTCRWYAHSDPLTRVNCPKCIGENDIQYHPNWATIKKQWEKANESNNG